MSLMSSYCPVCKKETNVYMCVLKGSILPGNIESGIVRLNVCRECGSVIIPEAIKNNGREK